MSNMKRVRLTLSALTRVEYEEVVEVPADFDESDIQELVNYRYDVTDGGAFSYDTEYWERGNCYGEFIEPDIQSGFDTKPTVRVSARGADGSFVIEDITE